MHRQNARINGARLELHGGSLTAWLDLVLDGSSVGAGGLRLFTPGGPDVAGLWVWGLLTTFEVSRWEELKGQHIRIESETPTGPVARVGHILKDKWFDMRGLPAKPVEG